MAGAEQFRVRPLANDFVRVYESPDPNNIYTYSPGIVVLPSGRLVATLDLSGPGIGNLPGPKQIIEHEQEWFGKVFVSDDQGRTWTHKTDFPFMHARPFLAGQSLYVIGHCNYLCIMRSDDEGETWNKTAILTESETWHQAPSNVHYANGNVYLVMERITAAMNGWPCSVMAPVLMRGKVSDDLTLRENWTFASELVFRDEIHDDDLNYFGVPFFSAVRGEKVSLTANTTRWLHPIGWLETNVVQFTDKDHYFHDPAGRTFHLWARANTHGTGYAAIAKVVENDDGTMTTSLVNAPSGKTMTFVPCPGGQMKFHILFDEKQALFWLLSSQSTDSMTRAECLPPDRYNLPNGERHRLQLHFSKNCIDWCFAGIVSMTNSPKEARHYASMAIAGDDLVVLSRSGDERAANAHNGNFISFHRVRDFRGLVY